MHPVAGADPAAIIADDSLSRYAFILAFVASAAGLISIAVSHLCLGAALALLLFSRTRVRFPSIVWPLAGFVLWTILSTAFSDDPAAAYPQWKKFFVFAFVPVIFSTFRTIDQVRRLIEAWFVCGLAAALWSCVQFIAKWRAARAAGVDFYSFYIGDRITGFFGHWMTFSQALLLVFLMLASYLLFAESGRRAGRGVWVACSFVTGLALVLSYTRSIWIAVVVAGSYLIWNWRRKLLFLVPVVLVAAFVVAPGAARRRLQSITNPDPREQPRLIMWPVGVRMVKAYPWFGVGPQRVGPRFNEFLPPEIGELPPAYYEHLHNIYIHYAAERGLPVVGFLLWLFLLVLRDHAAALRRIKPWRGDDRRFILLGVIAATLGMMIVGCFDVTLGDSEVLGLYLCILAVGYRTVESLGLKPVASSP